MTLSPRHYATALLAVAVLGSGCARRGGRTPFADDPVVVGDGGSLTIKSQSGFLDASQYDREKPDASGEIMTIEVLKGSACETNPQDPAHCPVQSKMVDIDYGSGAGMVQIKIKDKNNTGLTIHSSKRFGEYDHPDYQTYYLASAEKITKVRVQGVNSDLCVSGSGACVVTVHYGK